MNQIRSYETKPESCPKCHDIHYYPAVEGQTGVTLVEVYCEVCCKHDEGFYRLCGCYQELAGKFACTNGCGYVVDLVVT